MRNRFLSALLILGLMTPDPLVFAHNTARPGAKKTASSGKSAASKKKTTKKKKPVSTARVRRVKRAFVASAELKSMARQLVDNRTPAAYEGVEAYARKHAGKDKGAWAGLAGG